MTRSSKTTEARRDLRWAVYRKGRLFGSLLFESKSDAEKDAREWRMNGKDDATVQAVEVVPLGIVRLRR